MAAQHNGDEDISVSQPNPDAMVVAPEGDIDLVRSPSLQVALQEAMGKLPRNGTLVVDLSGVSYMDSSGVATLVQSLQMSRKRGVALVLCAMQDRVRSIFEIARLDTVFSMEPTLGAALSAASQR